MTAAFVDKTIPRVAVKNFRGASPLLARLPRGRVVRWEASGHSAALAFPQALPPKEVAWQCDAKRTVAHTVLDVRRAQLFEGSKAHEVDAFDGRRLSIVFYTLENWSWPRRALREQQAEVLDFQLWAERRPRTDRNRHSRRATRFHDIASPETLEQLRVCGTISLRM